MRRLKKFEKRFASVPALFEQGQAPVKAYRGPGGTGKTDAALRDPRLVGKLYNALFFSCEKSRFLRRKEGVFLSGKNGLKSQKIWGDLGRFQGDSGRFWGDFGEILRGCGRRGG